MYRLWDQFGQIQRPPANRFTYWQTLRGFLLHEISKELLSKNEESFKISGNLRYFLFAFLNRRRLTWSLDLLVSLFIYRVLKGGVSRIPTKDWGALGNSRED